MSSAAASTRVLVVDDDIIVSEIVSRYLESEGVRTTLAGCMASGLAEYRAKRFDLVIADINLPDGEGFELVQNLRSHRDCAVIYMSSRGTSADRVRGLETADDYIVKPVDLPVLSARVKAVLRRYRTTPAPAAQIINLSNWTLDLVRRELADAEGQIAPLTRGEFDLFAALVQASPTALDRDYLLEVVASSDATTSVRSIDVMINRIRSKLGLDVYSPLKIETIRGVGYGFKGAKR